VGFGHCLSLAMASLTTEAEVPVSRSGEQRRNRPIGWMGWPATGDKRPVASHQ